MKIRKRLQLFTCRPESMVCSRSISTGTSCTLKQRTGSSRGVALPLAVETAVAWHAVLRLAATAQPRSQISVPLGAILVELVVPMQLASRLLIRSAALKPQHQFLGIPTSTPIALTLSRVTKFRSYVTWFLPFVSVRWALSRLGGSINGVPLAGIFITDVRDLLHLIDYFYLTHIFG